MTLMTDLLHVAEGDYASIDQALRAIEERIAKAGTSVDDWTSDQATKLRQAADELRARLDQFQAVVPETSQENGIGKIRSEMLNIDDLRRAVAAFGKYVSKWVGAN